MRRIAIDTQIEAPVARVWRALCDAAEVPLWDQGVIRAINPPVDYPRPGQTVLWAYRSERWPELIDRPQEVIPERKLRSILQLAPYYMDETYELTSLGGHTTVELTIDLTIQSAVLGPLLEHLWPGRQVRKDFEASLKGLKRYCEEMAYRGD